MRSKNLKKWWGDLFCSHKQKQDNAIDEAGKESFPASDPPAHKSITGE